MISLQKALEIWIIFILFRMMDVTLSLAELVFLMRFLTNMFLSSGGKQPVSLGDGCIQKGIIIHELMHAVGFFHEQSRADRDEYVKINWANVEAGLQDQFDKYSLNMIDHLGTKYDYGSVMHYAPTAFSKVSPNVLFELIKLF